MTITISADPVPLHVDAHGTIRVAGKRLTLESLIGVYQQGKTPEEILECFDGITLGDVYAVLSYYFHHREEVDAYIAEQEAAGDAALRELEAQGYTSPFRDRVLALRKQQED